MGKRLSGAQYKRKRHEKQAHIKRQAGSLLNYLQGTRKKEDSFGSESDLDFHEKDVADEINRTDSGSALIRTPPGKPKITIL
ncbi:hypothetical protein TNCT_552561 [Trichonephila clavata]|uniref:Uncharacterized protein n=1 Tax=Trichonephila clavata TaxID=2740835 RepID=A0A8X6GS34_TRICU|nr:hypothetical protein TNCT_552561 [Trichonephila clavata]